MPYFVFRGDELSFYAQMTDPKPTRSIGVKQGSLIGAANMVKEIMKSGQKTLCDHDIDLLNQKLFLGRSVQRTIKPGIRRAQREGKFNGEIYNNPAGEQVFKYKKGDIVEDLMYLGEAQCILRIHGTMVMGGCPWYSNDDLTEVIARETQWWIELMHGTQPLGWLRVDFNKQIELACP